jgi:CelD/BcsL family acetyltransferase involved in cellulose biosynthesis
MAKVALYGSLNARLVAAIEANYHYRLLGAWGRSALKCKFDGQEKSLFFSEEKNQKTFASWRRVQRSGTWPESFVQQIDFDRVDDFGALGRRWQALECEADCGFFRSWAFLGCLAEERFVGARLLSVREGEADVALALLGGRPRSTRLNETGDAAQDAVFIEHNGLLVRRGCEAAVGPALAHAVRAAGPVVLSGVDDATLAAARGAGWLELRQTRFAPHVDLPAAGGDFLATLSANARAQIRRSMRLFGADLRLVRAESLHEAKEFFAEMVEAHQAAWQRRGRPGAFADAGMRRFHLALIDRAFPRGEVDLLRVTAGGQHVGTLHAFLRDGRVMIYQSGFRYGHDKREKPGLVCHALAIGFYAQRGFRVYDFLAGGDRYKTSLAKGGEALHWAVLHRPWTFSGMLGRGRGSFRKPATSAAAG